MAAPVPSAAGAGRRLAAILTAVLLLTLGTATPASAHNRFVSSDPADASTVASTPAAVLLTFDEPAIALGTQVLVTGPDGPAARGAAGLVDNTVRQPLVGGAPAGRYTVDWRVTSSDGHPISGSFAFTSEAAGSGQAEPAQVPAPAEPTPAAWPWFLLAAALFGLAGTLMVLRRRREGSSDDAEVSAPAG